ncbi:hypothetical protein [Pseudarthrobacter sp. N5]|uniref:hypothetical protein n=1 Tax=Pseudarthrobacter sp. N5 TaxID=3418416 RepID=UPI003CF9267A
MTGTVPTRKVRIAVVIFSAAAMLSGCSSEGKGTPAWTAAPGSSPSGASPSATAPAGSASGSASPTPGGTSEGTPASGEAAPGATAQAWKVYTDSAKSVSFDLPQEWIAQSVPAEQGTLPGALKIEVKKPDGTYLATLQTGLPDAGPAACPDSARKPYVVVSSVPVDLPHLDGADTISPHVVFRIIQGYKFFGSNGITNLVGGADGKACELSNVVRGPAGKGNYTFGDVGSLRSFAVDEKVAPAKSFDTLDEAAKYVNEGSEFANVQRMLLSLKIKN